MVSGENRDEEYFKLPHGPNMIEVKPGNQGLILHLLRYLSETRIIVDSRLVDLVIVLMTAISRGLEFTSGFHDTEDAKIGFKAKFYAGLEQVLENKYLPVKYHSQIW